MMWQDQGSLDIELPWASACWFSFVGDSWVLHFPSLLSLFFLIDAASLYSDESCMIHEIHIHRWWGPRICRSLHQDSNLNMSTIASLLIIHNAQLPLYLGTDVGTHRNQTEECIGLVRVLAPRTNRSLVNQIITLSVVED